MVSAVTNAFLSCGLEGRKEASDEGKIFGQTDVREVQGHQEERIHPHYLRESEAQAETGLIPLICARDVH